MLKVGIIGMGYGAQVHLPVYENIKGCKVIALADNGSGKAVEMAQNYEGCDAFSSGMQLVRNSDVDLVSIASPPQFHHELTVEALRCGKHVYCEKPFCTSFSEVSEIAKILQSSTSKLCVGYEFPDDEGFVQMQSALDKKTIGEIQRINVKWLTSGGFAKKPDSWKTSGQRGSGLLYDWVCHVIDYTALIAKSEYEWVRCEPHSANEFDIFCSFKNGVSAHFHISNVYRAGLGHHVRVIGDKGEIVNAHVPPFTKVQKSLVLRDTRGALIDQLPCTNTLDDIYPDNRMAAMHRMVGNFLTELLKGSKAAYPDVMRAFRVWKVLEALEASVLSGQKELIR